jgi:hypothetical protein
MKSRSRSVQEKFLNDTFKALRRAAKKAAEWARLTGTPAYVIKDGRIVDVAKRKRKT